MSSENGATASYITPRRWQSAIMRHVFFWCVEIFCFFSKPVVCIRPNKSCVPILSAPASWNTGIRYRCSTQYSVLLPIPHYQTSRVPILFGFSLLVLIPRYRITTDARSILVSLQNIQKDYHRIIVAQNKLTDKDVILSKSREENRSGFWFWRHSGKSTCPHKLRNKKSDYEKLFFFFEVFWGCSNHGHLQNMQW